MVAGFRWGLADSLLAGAAAGRRATCVQQARNPTHPPAPDFSVQSFSGNTPHTIRVGKLSKKQVKGVTQRNNGASKQEVVCSAATKRVARGPWRDAPFQAEVAYGACVGGCEERGEVPQVAHLCNVQLNSQVAAFLSTLPILKK
jgi:hypothetical protein